MNKWKQPGSTWIACGPFTKQKFRETGILKHLHRNELDKACLAHKAAFSHSKDLAKRTISGNVLKEKAFKIARNPKSDGYQRVLASVSKYGL